MNNEQQTIDLTSHDILGISMEWMLFAIQDCGLEIKNIVPCKFSEYGIAVQTKVGDWLFTRRGDKYVCAGFSSISRSFDKRPSMYP